MLGRIESESPAHAALAAQQGRWSGVVTPDGAAPASAAPQELVELLDLGGATDTLATVASIADLAAVVHLGHPEQPAPGIEEALLAGGSAGGSAGWSAGGSAGSSAGGGVGVGAGGSQTTGLSGR